VHKSTCGNSITVFFPLQQGVFTVKKTLFLLALALLAVSTVTPAFADGGPFIPPGKTAASLTDGGPFIPPGK